MRAMIVGSASVVILIFISTVATLLFINISHQGNQEVITRVVIPDDAVGVTAYACRNYSINETKPFLYLVQVAGTPNRQIFDNLPNEVADIEYLTYSHIDPNAAIYYPGSTWTEGRNALYHLGLLRESRQEWKYKYFVIMDGDISFSKEISVRTQFERWHNFLLEWEPAIASPMYHNRPTPLTDAVFSYGLPDAMMNAIHHDTFGFLLPYSTYWDSQSWWASQAVFAVRASLFYRGNILMYGGMSSYNAKHTPYPSRHPWHIDVLQHSLKVPVCSAKDIEGIDCFPPVNEITLPPKKKDYDYTNPTCSSYMGEREMQTKDHGAYSFGIFCVYPNGTFKNYQI